MILVAYQKNKNKNKNKNVKKKGRGDMLGSIRKTGGANEQLMHDYTSLITYMILCSIKLDIKECTVYDPTYKRMSQ